MDYGRNKEGITSEVKNLVPEMASGLYLLYYRGLEGVFSSYQVLTRGLENR